MLKRLVHIVIFLLAGTSISQATHILGGEITYEHLTDNQYRFYVKIYRDCGECLLAGRGGGDVSKDCGGFKVNLRSSGLLSCSPTELASFTPTFVSYEQVLPVCENTRTLCDSNSNFNYGAEVHTYQVDIDLDNYSSYLSCGFEVYVKTSSRSDLLDNIQEKEALFYNFAFINPANEHSSPQFNSQPDFLLSQGQSVRHKLFEPASVSDSVHVTLVKPLRDQEKPLTYQTGYSSRLPLTVFCNGNSACNPDAQNEPPIGITIDENTGVVHFTPMRTGEQVVMVYEMELWKRINGEMVLSSLIRRDIHKVVITDKNSAPRVYTSKSYLDDIITVCVGDTLDMDFLVEDLREQFPDRTFGPSDTVNFEWKFSGANASITEVPVSNGPFNKLNVKWAPQKQDLNSGLFRLDIEATDDHCPLRASGHRTYWLKVQPSPEVDMLPRRLKCGNVDLFSRVRTTTQYLSYHWEMVGPTPDLESNMQRDTFLITEAGSYDLQLTVTNDLGCSDVVNQQMIFTEKQVRGPQLSLIGDLIICEGDTASLELESEYQHKRVNWFINGFLVDSTDALDLIAGRGLDNGRLLAEVQVDDLGLTCLSRIDTVFNVDIRPQVSISEPAPMCPPAPGVELLDYVSPKIGQFRSDNIALSNGTFLETADLPGLYKGGTYCFDYSVTSGRGNCVVTEPVCVELYPKPELIMKDVTNCDFNGRFLMNNLMERPHDFNGLDLTWNIDGSGVTIPNVANQFWYDLNNLDVGRHEVITDALNSWGCRTVDTASLNLLDSVKIQLADITEICQSREDVDLNDLFNVSPTDGIWNSIEYSEELQNNFLDAKVCGDDINLTYTYDQFGCFDSKTITLDIHCAPNVVWEFDNDSVCSDQLIQLDVFPLDGTWSGPGVSGDQWNTMGLNGDVDLSYTYSDAKCSFDYDFTSYVVPKANMDLPILPERICQGDDIEIKGMVIRNGALHFKLDEYSRVFEEGSHDFTIKPSEERKQLLLDFRLETYYASCAEQVVHTVNVDPVASIFLLNKDLSGCSDFHFDPGWSGNQDITDWSKVSFMWDFGVNNDPNAIMTGSDARYTYREPGNHKLALTTRTEAGCEWSEQLATIQVYPSPEAYFTIEEGEYLSISNTSVQFINESECFDPMRFEWDFGTRSGVRFSTEESPLFAYPKDTGLFKVKLRAISNKECVDSFIRDLRVGPDMIMYVPTAFSPNGKGPQQTERHKVSGENIKDYEIWILSRWGDIVYHSTDINGSWDGKFKGAYCQPGVYAYKILAFSESGQEYKLGGTITLLR